MTTTKDSLNYDQISIANSFDVAAATGEIPSISLKHFHARNTDVSTVFSFILKEI